MGESSQTKLGAVCGILFAVASALAAFLRQGELVGAASYGSKQASGALPDALAAVFLLGFIGALDVVLADAEQRQASSMRHQGSETLRKVGRLAGAAAGALLLVASMAEAACHAAPGTTESTMTYVNHFTNVVAAAPLALCVVGLSFSLPLLDGGGRLVGVLGLLGGALLATRLVSLVEEPNAMFGARGEIGPLVFVGFCGWVLLTSVVILRHLGQRR